MRKLIYILLLLPFCVDAQWNKCNSEPDCVEVQECIDADYINDLVVHPTPLLNIIECDGPFVVQSARTGWWGTWSPIYTANSGTVTEDWIAVRSVTSPECVTDASIDFDMGLTYYQLRRMRMYYWIDWRVLINGAVVYTETYDVYHYDDERQDTNPDVIPPLKIKTHDNGYANAVRLNVPANATVAIETRQRYNFSAAQTSAYGRVISGLRSNHKVDFELRTEITDVTIQSVDKWWINKEELGYTAGFGNAPESATEYNNENQYLRAVTALESELEKANVEFADKFTDEIRDEIKEFEKEAPGQIKKQSLKQNNNKTGLKILGILALIALYLLYKNNKEK